MTAAAAVRFGLVLPIQAKGVGLDDLVAQLREEVAAAERAGFDAVMLTEFHQARGGALVSPMLVGAALLQGTSRIRFVTAVLAAPLHHPVRLAEDALMLQWMTRGRVALGLGIGHQVPDFEVYGVDRDHRADDLSEAVAVLRACFSGQPFRHEGRRWRLEGRITPAPYGGQAPPVWMGAHSDAGLARAARMADRWICDPQRDIDAVAGLASTYRSLAAAAGRPARVALFREAWIADSRATCEQVWAPHALEVHRLYYNVGVYLPEFEPWVDEVGDRSDFTLERVAPGRFLYGSGSDIRVAVADWCARTGADYLAVRLRHPGGPTHDETLEAIARFGDEVVAPMAAAA